MSEGLSKGEVEVLKDQELDIYEILREVKLDRENIRRRNWLETKIS